MTRIAGRLQVSAFRAAYALPVTMAVGGFAALSAQEAVPPVCGRVVGELHGAIEFCQASARSSLSEHQRHLGHPG